MRSSSPRSSGVTTSAGSVARVRKEAPDAPTVHPWLSPFRRRPRGSAAFQLASSRSRFRRAMKSTLIPLGHASWQAPWFVQLPKPSRSCWATMSRTRRVPLGLRPAEACRGGSTLAAVKSMAEALGHAATQAPHPMHWAASMAWSASSLADGNRVGVGGAPGAHRDVPAGIDDPVECAPVHHQVPDAPGNAVARQGSIQISSPSLKIRMWSWHVATMVRGPWGTPLIIMPHDAADALAAVVLEGDGLFALPREALVHQVQHLQEGGVLADVLGLVGLEAALGSAVRPAARRVGSGSLLVAPRGELARSRTPGAPCAGRASHPRP